MDFASFKRKFHNSLFSRVSYEIFCLSGIKCGTFFAASTSLECAFKFSEWKVRTVCKMRVHSFNITHRLI